MLKVSLNSFDLEGRRVHQVFANSTPIIPETEDYAKAERVAQETFMRPVAGSHGRRELWRWQGGTSEPTLVDSRTA